MMMICCTAAEGEGTTVSRQSSRNDPISNQFFLTEEGG